MSRTTQHLLEYLKALVDQGVDPVAREAEIWDTYGRRVAAMVLDSTGFTRASQQYGMLHSLTRLVLLRDIVKPILVRHDMIHFKYSADNVFGFFERAEDAVNAAFEAHQQVAARNLMLMDGEPFRVCIGIGYGDMLFSDTLEGYFGEEMNLASKLGEDVARGGETLVSRNAALALPGDMRALFEERSVQVSGVEIEYLAASDAPSRSDTDT